MELSDTGRREDRQAAGTLGAVPRPARAAEPSGVGQRGLAHDGTAARADAQRNRQTIVECALRVLSRDPAAPLSDVAAEAGLSRATVYRHFPNRESVEEAIREAALASASRTIAEAELSQGSASGALERGVRGLVRLGPRFGVLLREGASPGSEFLERRDEALRPLLDVVHRAQAENELDPSVDARWAYQALTALLVAAARAGSMGTLAPDAAASLVCRTLFDGLRPPGRRRRAVGRRPAAR